MMVPMVREPNITDAGALARTCDRESGARKEWLIHSHQPLSMTSIPFRHQGRRRKGGWRMTEWTYQPALVWLPLGLISVAIAGGGIGVAGHLLGLGYAIELVLLLAYLALGMFISAVGLLLVGRYRYLEYEEGSSSFALGGGNLFVPRSRYRKIVPAAEAALGVHPVATYLTAKMMEDGRLGWGGYALVLHLRDDRFLLACQKTMQQVEASTAKLQHPLSELPRTFGSEIRGLAYR
jgi:hypothetical protein